MVASSRICEQSVFSESVKTPWSNIVGVHVFGTIECSEREGWALET